MYTKNKLFIIVFTICVISLLLGLIIPIDKKIQSKTNSKSFSQIIAQNNKVAVISLYGVISSTPEKNVFVEENSSLVALNAIKSAIKDEEVKGVIIKINSPGGTVGMSQRIYSAVMQLRAKKPVIAVIEDIGASGGYYVACAANRIVALPGSMTGSIGVIMSTVDAHELLTNKLGIRDNVIKSGRFKDIGSSTRAMTREERELLQDMVDDSFDQFRMAIIKGRVERDDNFKTDKQDLTIENLDTYADGRVFTGRQALDYGFVDSIGGYEAAQKMMKDILSSKKIAITDDSFVSYGKANSLSDFLGLKQESSAFENLIPQSMKYARKPLYLWE